MATDDRYVGRHEFTAFAAEVRTSLGSVVHAIDKQGARQEEFIREFNAHRMTPWRTLAAVVGLLLVVGGVGIKPYIDRQRELVSSVGELEKTAWFNAGVGAAHQTVSPLGKD